MSIFNIPYAYQMYGRIRIEAESLDEALEKAEEKINDMSEAELAENADYLDDSCEVDSDGIILDDDGNIIEND